jgi:hypothetical protein
LWGDGGGGGEREGKGTANLLAIKHAGDVFVPECKNGPTHGSSHLRMDAWTMRRSWTAPQITGYEIKVSRADFLGDKKWPSYLPYCHYFTFVVAPGVCDPSEVPEQCGLLIASKTGSRLFQKRKPVYRDVVIPDTLWMYILICRAEITGEYTNKTVDADYWRDWLAKKEEDREIGHRVSTALSRKYSADVVAVQTKQKWLESEIRHLKEIKEWCKELEITPCNVWSQDHLQRLVAERTTGISQRLRRAIETAADAMQTIQNEIGEEVA